MGRVLSRSVYLLSLFVLLFLSGWERTTAVEESVEHALWSSYWTVEPGFTSTLEMKNNRMEETLTVQVSLYFANGEKYYLAPMQLAPRQTAVINLNQVYESLPASLQARAGRAGTVEVVHNGPNFAALMGGVSVTNPEQGLGWNFRLYLTDPDSELLPVAGLFWFPDPESDGFVAAQNASEDFLAINPSFRIGGESFPLPPVQLAPGHGYKLELRKALRQLGLNEVTAGTVEFTFQGTPDALKAHGVLFNQRGFSTEIDFHRVATWPSEQTFTLRTPRFALGAADPRLGLPAGTLFEPTLALQNFSDAELAVTLAVGFRTTEAPQELQFPLTLGARETRLLHLAELLAAQVPAETHWASVELSYQGVRNYLAAELVSVSREGEHSLRSVMNPVQGSAAEGWLWRADGDSNTLIGILNTDTEEATVRVALDYFVEGVGHSYELAEISIPPRVAELVDVGAIIASGQPDEDGDVIPAGVSFGGYSVRKVGRRLDQSLTTEALVFNRRTKNFLTLYNTCCGYTSVNISPSSLEGTVGGSGQIRILAFDFCSGTLVDLTFSGFYSSDNSSVASVNAIGSVSYVGAGSTSVHASISYCTMSAPCIEGFNCGCFPAFRSKDIPVTVKPIVNVSCSNQHLALGSTAPFATKTGNCSTSVTPAGGTFSWSVNTNTITLNPLGSTAEYTAANQSTNPDDTVISVTYTVNGQSATAQSQPITVHKPTSLFVESDTTNPTGTVCNVTCLDGSPGCSYNSYLRTRIYVVQDQFNQLFTNVGIDAVDVRESFSGFTSTCGAPPPATEVATTSRFDDNFSFCSSACLPGGPSCTNSATQAITVNGFSVRTVSVTWTCPSVSLNP